MWRGLSSGILMRTCAISIALHRCHNVCLASPQQLQQAVQKPSNGLEAMRVCSSPGIRAAAPPHTAGGSPVGVLGTGGGDCDLLHEPGAGLRSHQEGGQGAQLSPQEADLVHGPLLEAQLLEASLLALPAPARQRLQRAVGAGRAQLLACRLQMGAGQSRGCLCCRCTALRW